MLKIHWYVKLSLLSSSIRRLRHHKTHLLQALGRAKWASTVLACLCWCLGPCTAPLQCEAAFLSCRYSRYWIKQVCCCRQTPGTFLAGAVFGLEFPGPYQEPPLVTQPVPELTLTFIFGQGLAEHLTGKRWRRWEFRCSCPVPLKACICKWSLILEIILGPLNRRLRGRPDKGKVLLGVKNTGTVTLWLWL